jgi:hypothetical protein
MTHQKLLVTHDFGTSSLEGAGNTDQSIKMAHGFVSHMSLSLSLSLSIYIYIYIYIYGMSY